jgi:hypothetical protein
LGDITKVVENGQMWKEVETPKESQEWNIRTQQWRLLIHHKCPYAVPKKQVLPEVRFVTHVPNTALALALAWGSLQPQP